MGIDYQSFRFLRGVPNFGAVLTLGRQEMMMSKRRCKKLGIRYEKYADHMLCESLGARSVRSLDYSGFEGATFIHDMNTPIPPPANWARFDTVIDGGTLEHVFNLPVALASIMELVRLGGNLVIEAPTNNWCGHGYYQFSPELFFSTLNRTNGYQIQRMIVHRIGSSRWYEVLNPLETGRRSELVSRWPIVLRVYAKRVEKLTPFAAGWPQQPDYTARWAKAADSKPLHPFWAPLRTLIAFWRMSLRNKNCFKPYAQCFCDPHHQEQLRGKADKKNALQRKLREKADTASN